MGKTNGKHFAAIADASENEIGLTPVIRNGIPAYSESYDTALSPQFYNGEMSYDRFEPQKEIAIVQSDNRGGMGLEYANNNNPKRYLNAIGCDARFRDEIRLGPLPATLTKVTLPTLTDGELDVWTSSSVLTNWTKTGAGTMAREATIIYSGTYSAQLQSDGASTLTSAVFSGWANTFRGKLISISVWVKGSGSGADATTIAITDGVGTTTSSGYTITTAWQKISVIRTLAMAATKIQAVIVNDGTLIAYVDLCEIAAYGSCDSQCDFNGVHYFSSGAVLSKIDTGGTMHLASNKTHLIAIMPATITQLFVGNQAGTDYLFVCLGWSKAYYYMTPTVGLLTSNAASGQKDVIVADDSLFYVGQVTLIKDSAASEICTISSINAGTNTLTMVSNLTNSYTVARTASVEIVEAFTLSNLTSNTLKYMCVSGATFYGSDTNSTIVSTTNPINAGTNWGTSKQIGEDAYNIVDMKTFGGLVYAKKSDCKVYYINASGTVVVLIDGQANLTGTNTAQMFVWREESLLIPYGAQALFLYDGTTITDVSPSSYIKGTSEYIGQIQAVTGDEKYIYAILDNSTKVEVLTLNYEEVDGKSDWRWHGSLAEITLTGCASAYISSVYKKWCHILSTLGTDSYYYIPVCAKYGNIASDTDYTYQTGGYLITSWEHYNLKGDTKAWIKLTLKMSGTTSAIYWRAYYQKFGDSSWTEISPTPTFFKTSPSTTAYIPVDGSSNKPVSNMIRFKFEGVTNAEATSPVLLAWDVRGIWYPTEKKMISMQVRVKDNLPTEQGQTDDQLGSTIRSTLDNLNSLSWPRAFYPPYWESASDTIYIKKLPLPEGRRPLQMVQNERDKTSEWVYELFLEVVPLS